MAPTVLRSKFDMARTPDNAAAPECVLKHTEPGDGHLCLWLCRRLLQAAHCAGMFNCCCWAACAACVVTKGPV